MNRPPIVQTAIGGLEAGGMKSVIGRSASRLVECFTPFPYLLRLNLSPKTLQKHRGSARLLSGEITSDLHETPRLRKRPTDQVLVAALNDEDGLVLSRASEGERRSFDTTCRTLSLPQRASLREPMTSGCGDVDNARASLASPQRQQQI
jgi:hypothetical protein